MFSRVTFLLYQSNNDHLIFPDIVCFQSSSWRRKLEQFRQPISPAVEAEIKYAI